MLADLQEKLFAHHQVGDDGRRILLVLQAMDTAGKGGIVKHVIGAVDPQGVQLAAFKKPTEEELEHDFLWRIRKQVPEAGMIGVFDRSHYEDVLIARVRELATPEEIERRYGAINEFEAELVADGHHDHQGHAAHLARRAEGARSRTGSSGPTSTGSTTPATSTSGCSGRSTRRRTRSAFERTRRRSRRGTSCPPTTSGTRAWPCSTCCIEALEALRARAGRSPTSTSRPRSCGCSRAELLDGGGSAAERLDDRPELHDGLGELVGGHRVVHDAAAGICA